MKAIRHALSSALYTIASRIEPFDREEYDRVKRAILEKSSRCHTVRGTPIPEQCERCDRNILVGYSLPRDVWRAIAGEEIDSLCIDCLDALAAEKRVRYTLSQLMDWPWYEVETLRDMMRRRGYC